MSWSRRSHLSVSLTIRTRDRKPRHGRLINTIIKIIYSKKHFKQKMLLSHFSPKPSFCLSPLFFSSLSLTSLRFRSSKSPFYTFHSLKSRSCPTFSGPPSLACRVSAGTGGGTSGGGRGVVSMDSPSPDLVASVDSVADDLKNQSLGSDDGNDRKKHRLKLEDLNWDHSFVRELPGDPRTDKIPREVSLLCFLVLFCLFSLFLTVEKNKKRLLCYASKTGGFLFIYGLDVKCKTGSSSGKEQKEVKIEQSSF